MADKTPTELPVKSTSGTSPPVRRPFHGSCHCGATKYVAYLTLPTDQTFPKKAATHTTPIYRCNCNTCHKMGILHTRPMDPPGDFFLLSPLNPMTGGLQDYYFAKNSHWYFCPTCGVRCFTFCGEGEVKEVEIEGEKQPAWGVKREGWQENPNGYLSVNAVTLDVGQEGLDLREWTEKGWIEYYDMRDGKEDQMGRPHEGDMY